MKIYRFAICCLLPVVCVANAARASDSGAAGDVAIADDSYIPPVVQIPATAAYSPFDSITITTPATPCNTAECRAAAVRSFRTSASGGVNQQPVFTNLVLDKVVPPTSGTPLWYGAPKSRNTSEELVKTVDINAVPWWDDSVSHPDKTDFSDDFQYTGNPEGRDWQWWVNNGFAPNDRQLPGPNSKFWDPNVDYDHFEYYTDAELAARRAAAAEGGYTDPWVEMHDSSDQPHFVNNLPPPAGKIPALSVHDRFTERAVEDLLVPQMPTFHWNETASASAESAAATAVINNVNFTGPAAAPAPAPASVSREERAGVTCRMFNAGISTAKNPACEGPTKTIAIETCEGTKYVECPFTTDWECKIWLKKPQVSEAISPRAPRIRQVNVDALAALIKSGNEITPDVADARPLVARYRTLMSMARACCTDGMVSQLASAGATQGLIYKFLVDDANFYGFGDRCLMMTDRDLNRFANTATSSIVGDVRNGCLCRQRQWYRALLAPFQQVEEAAPEWSSQRFDYTYTDGLQRQVTVSINNDVKNVLTQLNNCP
ncbi:MAG: hypothetical protein FWC61_03070 [Proteobacteria bacterium]|nr:hypothetical protein [Pseudomonadota bacterium]